MGVGAGWAGTAAGWDDVDGGAAVGMGALASEAEVPETGVTGAGAAGGDAQETGGDAGGVGMADGRSAAVMARWSDGGAGGRSGGVTVVGAHEGRESGDMACPTGRSVGYGCQAA